MLASFLHGKPLARQASCAKEDDMTDREKSLPGQDKTEKEK